VSRKRRARASGWNRQFVGPIFLWAFLVFAACVALSINGENLGRCHLAFGFYVLALLSVFAFEFLFFHLLFGKTNSKENRARIGIGKIELKALHIVWGAFFVFNLI